MLVMRAEFRFRALDSTTPRLTVVEWVLAVVGIGVHLWTSLDLTFFEIGVFPLTLVVVWLVTVACAAGIAAFAVATGRIRREPLVELPDIA